MSDGGGGAATASGMNFQALVAAWYAVGILAEDEMPPPLGLAAGTRLEWLMCESGEPVDDLLVATSSGGFLFGQLKNSISLVETPKSEFAGVVDQFVRQFLTNRDQSVSARSWNRPLDPSIDRLLLIVGPDSPGSIRNDLPSVLEKVRSLAGRSLDDAGTSTEEKRALRVLRAHINTSWQSATTKPASVADELAILPLIRVQVLDLRQDGSGEREARQLLRASVLADSTADGAAWDTITRHCAELSARRASTDRSLLREALRQNGIACKVPPSFRNDIERLKAYTSTSLEFLSDLSKIDSGPIQVKIRRACSKALLDAALLDSFLVVGEPGAGKSGALHELAVAGAAHADCIVLLVDRLNARNLRELNEELGLEHGLVETLKQWTSTRPGIIVVDALDAARDERAAHTIRDLIRLVVPLKQRWHVVASIRKFDLRYGDGIKSLFLGKPAAAEFVEDEFSSIKHINVRRLNDDELTQIGAQAPLLAELLLKAPDDLRGLLRVPFNIRLVADLLAGGVSSADLTPIRTQLELLDRYWAHRVLGGDSALGDQRESVLRAACEQMIATRSLHANRAALASFSPDALKALLSGHVLAEWADGIPGTKPNRYLISFSHHVLYDYSVARLLMRGPSDQLLRRLQDQDFVLIARPSVGLHFQHLWTTQPSEFWKVSFEMLSSGTSPKTVELIGPTVATQGMTSPTDFTPLYTALESGGDTQRTAELFLSHVAGAILTDQLPLVGPGAKPWCEVIERMTSQLTRGIAFPLRALALAALEKLGSATSDQRVVLGRAARRILAYALENLAGVRNMIPVWIQVVCRTCATDVAASEALLRRVIEPARMKERGYLEVPWIAREIEHVIAAAPALARDIYVSTFLHQEESTEATRMGNEQLVPLASNRKQDFESALWSLSEAYGELTKAAPVQATEALVPIIEDYVRRRHRFAQEEASKFEFLGQQLELRSDFSSIWDSGSTYSHDDAVKLLDAFGERIRELSSADDNAILGEIIAKLSTANPVAVVWRRLLTIAGEDGGEPLARLLLPLLKSPVVIIGRDTTGPAARLLKARAVTIKTDDLREIEQLLLALPETLGDKERGEYLRARLLGAIPSDRLVLEQSRSLVEELRAKDEIPSSEPSAGWQVFQTKYTEEDHLQELGVKLDDDLNKRIFELTRAIRQFGANANDQPSGAEVEAFIPAVAQLVALLESDGVAAKEATYVNYTWGHVAAACARAARSSELNEQSAQLLKQYLLRASENPEPRFNEAQEEQFDTSPGWGSPSARIDAASGLMALGRGKNGATEDLRTAAQRLAFDQVAAVRYQVAVRLLHFYEADRQFVWELAAALAERETNRGVLLGLVGRTLGRLSSTNADEGFRLLRTIFDRVPRRADRDEVHRQVTALVAQLFAYRGNAKAGEMVRELIAGSARNPRAAEDLLHPLRSALIYGAEKDRSVRQRALGVYLELLRSVDGALQRLESDAKAQGEWTETNGKAAEGVAAVLQDICMQVYFASGAFETKKRTHGNAVEDDDSPDDSQSRRFYSEADELLTELTRVRFAPAAHKVVETLAFFVPEDPERIFTRIAQCVRNSRAGGYQFESLAASLIVSVVERYLADYRHIFRENERCRRDLLELLDTFVEAGWPSARKLTYKLDEIFR
jgi:hypothetical protein